MKLSTTASRLIGFDRPRRSGHQCKRYRFTFYNVAMNGGNRALQKAAPTSLKADAVVDQRLAAPAVADANDLLYQWDSSRDFDPSAGLERIRATVLLINSADDERNPPDLGVVDASSCG